MEQVILTSFADDKLVELANILYEKRYFGFRHDAKKYVSKIYHFIYSIPQQRRKQTKNKKYGAFYCSYKPNRHTHYFITFDTENDLYIIKNVINNHTKDYPAFIRGLK